MCNYYSRYKPPRYLQDAFRWEGPLPNMEPRYVVRPTNIEAVVAIGKDSKRRLVPMRWGLVPPWAKDLKTGLTLFNARAETLLEKASFRDPFVKGRRCLVPVDGFFEFSGARGAKQPHYFKPHDDRVMAFAGLWETWRGPKDAPLAQPQLSFTFATTAPNATVAPIHDRMPVLLSEPSAWDAWLAADASPEALQALLRPAPDDLLQTYPVTRALLQLKEPGPDVLLPATGTGSNGSGDRSK